MVDKEIVNTINFLMTNISQKRIPECVKVEAKTHNERLYQLQQVIKAVQENPKAWTSSETAVNAGLAKAKELLLT